MKFFEAVPGELFSPLASPNRTLYADALDVLYTAYRENLKIREDTLYSMLRSRLEQQLADATFEGEDIDEEELRDILERGEAVERCIRAGQDRTEADRDFHAAIVRAAHNEFMVRLLPVIHQAVAAAVESGEHGEQLAEDTLRDHALLLEFLAKRDGEGAEHAMAIHMCRSMEVMGLG